MTAHEFQFVSADALFVIGVCVRCGAIRRGQATGKADDRMPLGGQCPGPEGRTEPKKG